MPVHFIMSVKGLGKGVSASQTFLGSKSITTIDLLLCLWYILEGSQLPTSIRLVVEGSR